MDLKFHLFILIFMIKALKTLSLLCSAMNHDHPTVAKRYFVPPPLIAICCPYLEPARFAWQNLSVEMQFHVAQI